MIEGLLGIDIGNIGLQGPAASTPSGDVLASQTATYGLSQPQARLDRAGPDSSGSKARAQAVAGVRWRSSRDVEIVAIGLSGQMHGLTPLDASHRVLRPAILWNDQRNGAECADITERAGGVDGLLELTNNRMLVGFTGGKIVWMRNHEAELFGRLRHVLNPKDYLRLVLTGEVATEVSDASGTGLFDVKRRIWATGLLELLGDRPGHFAGLP